jgi:hypothetical protein
VTVAGPSVEPAAEMITLASALGPFPHAKLDRAPPPSPSPAFGPAPDLSEIHVM